MKKCFKCNQTKELVEFYKHGGMGDGRLGKCKECTKKDSAIREKRLRNDPEWIIKEKKRARDKYYRLGYKDKHKPTSEKKKLYMNTYNDMYPEKLVAKCACDGLKKKDGYQNHHWSYNKKHYLDVILVESKLHYKIHRYMTYDQERMMYRNTDGVLLDTRERHEEHIEKCKELD